MKLLHWHKLANEAALKAALIRTKRLRREDRVALLTQRQREKAAWLQQVVHDEETKPLVVDDDFVRHYEAREAADEARLESQVRRNITNLQKVKADLVKRAETAAASSWSQR